MRTARATTMILVNMPMCFNSDFKWVFEGNGSDRTLDGRFRRVRCCTGSAGRSMTAAAAPELELAPTAVEAPPKPDIEAEPETSGAISS